MPLGAAAQIMCLRFTLKEEHGEAIADAFKCCMRDWQEQDSTEAGAQRSMIVITPDQCLRTDQCRCLLCRLVSHGWCYGTSFDLWCRCSLTCHLSVLDAQLHLHGSRCKRFVLHACKQDPCNSWTTSGPLQCVDAVCLAVHKWGHVPRRNCILSRSSTTVDPLKAQNAAIPCSQAAAKQ